MQAVQKLMKLTKQFAKQTKQFAKQEDGAALVEYSVLLGVMLVAVIGTIVLVGGWINTKWTALLTALSGS